MLHGAGGTADSATSVTETVHVASAAKVNPPSARAADLFLGGDEVARLAVRQMSAARQPRPGVLGDELGAGSMSSASFPWSNRIA